MPFDGHPWGRPGVVLPQERHGAASSQPMAPQSFRSSRLTSRSPGVYSWWLGTSRFPTCGDAVLYGLPDTGGYFHPVEGARLLYVGRARRNLQQRIMRQRLHRPPVPRRCAGVSWRLCSPSSGSGWRAPTGMPGVGCAWNGMPRTG